MKHIPRVGPSLTVGDIGCRSDIFISLSTNQVEIINFSPQYLLDSNLALMFSLHTFTLTDLIWSKYCKEYCGHFPLPAENYCHYRMIYTDFTCRYITLSGAGNIKRNSNTHYSICLIFWCRLKPISALSSNSHRIIIWLCFIYLLYLLYILEPRF